MEPYYKDDYVTIYHGDCREIVPILGNFDLLLTDPPYGIGWDCNYSSRFTRSDNKHTRKTKRSYDPIQGDDTSFDPTKWMGFNNVIIWGAPCFLKNLPNGSLLIWYKRNSNFLAPAEAAWFNKGYGVYIYKEPVEKMQNERSHPTQKPVGLMTWCVHQVNSYINTILDPFAGSGTVGRAAKDLNRQAVLIEKEEQYCEIAANRMRQEVLPLHA